MDLGENGNRANSGQKLTKINGNQKVIRVVSPNSDMVCGIPHETEIDPNQCNNIIRALTVIKTKYYSETKELRFKISHARIQDSRIKLTKLS